MNEATYTFYVRDELVIIGSNPEMADIANPRGDIEGLAHNIVAEAEDGTRFINRTTAITTVGGTPVRKSWMDDPECMMVVRVDSGDMTVERLQAQAERLNAAQPKLTPAHWDPTFPAYGSPAYERAEQDIVAIERWQDEQDWRELR